MVNLRYRSGIAVSEQVNSCRFNFTWRCLIVSQKAYINLHSHPKCVSIAIDVHSNTKMMGIKLLHWSYSLQLQITQDEYLYISFTLFSYSFVKCLLKFLPITLQSCIFFLMIYEILYVFKIFPSADVFFKVVVCLLALWSLKNRSSQF